MQKEALSQLHSPHLPKKRSLPKELNGTKIPFKNMPKRKSKQTKTIQNKDIDVSK